MVSGEQVFFYLLLGLVVLFCVMTVWLERWMIDQRRINGPGSAPDVSLAPAGQWHLIGVATAIVAIWPIIIMSAMAYAFASLLRER